MGRARDNRKKNMRLEFAVRRIPAVAALHPTLARALRAIDAAAQS